MLWLGQARDGWPPRKRGSLVEKNSRAKPAHDWAEQGWEIPWEEGCHGEGQSRDGQPLGWEEEGT